MAQINFLCYLSQANDRNVTLTPIAFVTLPSAIMSTTDQADSHLSTESPCTTTDSTTEKSLSLPYNPVPPPHGPDRRYILNPKQCSRQEMARTHASRGRIPQQRVLTDPENRLRDEFSRMGIVSLP
ncbi:hypothetical protein E1B28_007912 [Marasmius oreades]|uniref:Uncharacterized protein n=1 Tax=Marasmius oreades TaxID=181124 RepID=A0A9P7UUH8_9AGAR|nr:uncharacterized protein E1B28_007912 [Marasmius oreades]KAG7094310.1 hypothetical protein E1B28_007912 [Marasmius oreades]